jgi:hypothetical protein
MAETNDKNIKKEDSLLDSLLARIRHPIFGAYAFSWFIWNWEVPYTLIRSTDSVIVTVGVIKSAYFSPWSNCFITPFWGVLLFVVLGPVLREIYQAYTDWITAIRAKWSPVPFVELDRALAAKQSADSDANTYRAAYFALQQGSDSTWPESLKPYAANAHEFSERIRTYFSDKSQLIQLQNERDVFKGRAAALAELLRTHGIPETK